MGGFSAIKLVKPIKTVCSWTPHQAGVCHLLVSKTKPNVGTAAAGILREADTAVRQEVRRLDATDCAFHQMPEFLPLFVGNGGLRVLNLHEPLANEYNLGRPRQLTGP